MLRATLKSLLARKLRLALSTMAVVLSVMFVAGSFVLTDTLSRSFDALFTNVYTYTDIEVSRKPNLDNTTGGAPLAEPLPAAVVERVKGIEGVKSATGVVFTNGANVVGKNGKYVPNSSGQRYGASWAGEDQVISLDTGRAPEKDTDVVFNKGLVDAAGYRIGDVVDITTPAGGRQQYTLVGTFVFAGGRAAFAGEHTVFFTEPTAQKTMLGDVGVYNTIDVRRADGASQRQVQQDVQAALGSDYRVKTGDELAKEQSQPLQGLFDIIRYVLLGFGAVALLVGIFLILNTFSIIVAQRTQELALLRAMGASAGQVRGSVLLEALVIGVIGSALGFGAGVGLGAGGAALLADAVIGIDVAGIAVPLIAVLSAFGIGITVTIVAALVPAFKASRVAPIAALREAAAINRPLGKITVAGGVLTAAAVAGLIAGLNGVGSNTVSLWLVLGGVLATLIGVALLTPILTKPIVPALGWLWSWSVPGKLGRRNSSRNPRRTAITAAAVMIGIALVTALSTIFTSVDATIGKLVDKEVKADLVIAGTQTSEIPPVLQPAELEKVRALPGVDRVAAAAISGAEVNGEATFVISYDDLPAAVSVLSIKAASGRVDRLASGEVLVEEALANDAKVKLGDKVRLSLPRLPEQEYTITGIVGKSAVNQAWYISHADAQRGFQYTKPTQTFLTVRDGQSVAETKRQIAEVIKDNPEVNVLSREEYVGNSTAVFDFFLYTVQVLLLVAIAISVLGVINTLVLSVIERTKELGLLRAIGLKRFQTARMITVESVVIALFGTLLGLAVGAGLGIATVNALKDIFGEVAVALPWTLMIVYVVAALFIGVFAAVIPAIRAARLNVLNAIAYE